jgi:hypothetical protein
LTAITACAAGKGDPQIFRHIFKLNNASGGPFFNGWAIDFFPYLEPSLYEPETRDRSTGHVITSRRNSIFDERVTADRIPGSLSRVPLRWHHFGEMYDITFIAGFTGFIQTEALEVQPKIGWAIVEN